METPYSNVMPIIPGPDVVFARGKGSWLGNRKGRRYPGFVQGWAVNCLRHPPQAMVDALKHQVEQLLNPEPGYYSESMLTRVKNFVECSELNEVPHGGPDDAKAI